MHGGQNYLRKLTIILTFQTKLLCIFRPKTFLGTHIQYATMVRLESKILFVLMKMFLRGRSKLPTWPRIAFHILNAFKIKKNKRFETE